LIAKLETFRQHASNAVRHDGRPLGEVVEYVSHVAAGDRVRGCVPPMLGHVLPEHPLVLTSGTLLRPRVALEADRRAMLDEGKQLAA
jgi:hypothetical protein